MDIHELSRKLEEKYREFNEVTDPELIDAIAYEILALNKRISSLLKKMKGDNTDEYRENEKPNGNQGERE